MSRGWHGRHSRGLLRERTGGFRSVSASSLGVTIMTNASKAISVAGWNLLSCLVAGCGGEGEENDALDATVVLNEAGFISVEESDDDPGFCGYLELGIDEFGGQVVAQERYYYSVMNRFLDENTELRDYTGLTQVGSCDEARLFTKLHNDYRDERPATAEDKAALVANL